MIIFFLIKQDMSNLRVEAYSDETQVLAKMTHSPKKIMVNVWNEQLAIKEHTTQTNNNSVCKQLVVGEEESR
jgi:hypothetical protein